MKWLWEEAHDQGFAGDACVLTTTDKAFKLYSSEVHTKQNDAASLTAWEPN